ncbi:hypothetical protein K488DRAFT_91656 [Vararia minispora EC-137]|uniref:Uncharacterized protein n=1 Tax=Vararia minispora EC-137 TaxID=1314806 RepID=A0ACB8Q5N8_9AGAM|nr:hypothetical protein K488DRAFT_91656 [Vararia minispora EC-137]
MPGFVDSVEQYTSNTTAPFFWLIYPLGSVFMVFEYTGRYLTSILVQTQFQLIDTHLKSCRQILVGLADVHRKGAIYRDIKDASILFFDGGASGSSAHWAESPGHP